MLKVDNPRELSLKKLFLWILHSLCVCYQRDGFSSFHLSWRRCCVRNEYGG